MPNTLSMKKYIIYIAILFLPACSDVQKQLDNTSETSRKADTLLHEFSKVDKALSNAKKRIDSALPNKQQEDSLLHLPQKLKRKFDSLIK